MDSFAYQLTRPLSLYWSASMAQDRELFQPETAYAGYRPGPRQYNPRLMD